MERLSPLGPDGDALLRLGRAEGEIADLFREATRSSGVTLEAGRVEEATEGVSDGVGLRIRLGGHTHFAHADAPEPALLLSLADDLARRAARPRTARDPAARPTPPRELRRAATPVDEPVGGVDLARKAALCLAADRAARAVDPRVKQVRVRYLDHRREFRLLASDGTSVEERQEGLFFSVLVVAADGDVVQTGYEAAGGATGFEFLGNHSIEATAVEAARRAVAMLSARRAPGGVMPVVLASSAGGTMVHEAVGHGLEADLVAEGHSTYAGRMGRAIASPAVTVVDDPTIPGRRGSYAFDDEGVPAERVVLVEKGVLRSWLHSRATALALGQRPNGHGRRESYSHLPIPRMANTLILPGSETPESVVRRTGTGLYVTRMGGGEVNTVNGDFVFEVAEGFRIEGGEVGEPLQGATLVGNGPTVLAAIDLVGSDLGFSLGTCGKDGQGAPVADAQPTLRIPEMVVGGEGESP